MHFHGRSGEATRYSFPPCLLHHLVIHSLQVVTCMCCALEQARAQTAKLPGDGY
jgi:hypothetical protein